MTVRRTLAPLLPLALCAALLVGCGDDDPDSDAGSGDPTSQATTEATDDPSTETEPGDPGETATDDTTGPEESDTPDETGGSGGQVPADAQELCSVFEDAFDAIEAASGQEVPTGDEPLPTEYVAALQQWGQGLADAELPADLGDDESAGIAAMSRLLLALPDDANGRDLESLETELSEEEDRQVQATGEYVEATCGVS